VSADARPLLLVANARMPSQRAQSLQVAQAAASFARAGVDTTLLHARRRRAPALAAGEDLWSHYAIPRGPRPRVEAVPCFDCIDLFPRALQYAPARLQELSFARNAARRVRRADLDVRVLSRELETAWALGARSGVFLEVHRVPGSRTRRRWLVAAASRAAGVVAISGGVRADLVALGVAPGSILVEHDAFEPARFAAAPARDAARRALDLAADATIAVYAGGLLEWKGVDLLVEAARAEPGLLVVVAGGMDADVARLRERARGALNVRIDGFQPPARVPLYLAAADFGVVPNRSTPDISARYTSPLKVFEAMSLGLPLLVSDLPSLREVLADDEALFVAPDSARELARGLARLARDAPLRAELGARLLARAPRHTWDARAARLLAWMEERA